MKKPDEMTLDECKKEIGTFAGPVWSLIPVTLSSVVGAFPDGWWFWINYCGLTTGNKAGQGIRDTFVCEAVHKEIVTRRVRVEADTEILARARLAVAAIRATTKE